MRKMTDFSLRLSRFAHVFERGNYKVLFHSLTVEVIFLSSKALRLVSEFKFGKTIACVIVQNNLAGSEIKSFMLLIEKLVKFKMLVPLSYNEDEELDNCRTNHLMGPAVNMAYLVLTDDCNLRCLYCFEKKDDRVSHTFSYMSSETVKRSLDLFVRWASKSKSQNKTVIFYGGEPLLNKEAFCAALKYISVLKKRELLPEKLEVSIVTNGTVLDRNTANLMRDNNVFVGLSIDGMPKTHDKYRCFPGNIGSFNAVEKGYKILKDAGVNISVSLTITPENVKNLLKHVRWVLERFEPRGVGLNLLMDSSGKIISSTEYAEIAAEQMIKCFEFLRKEGIYENRMMRKVEAFIKKRIYPYDCGGCGRQIVFLPSGEVGMCQAYIRTKKFFFVPDRKFSPYTNSDFRNWANRSPLTMSQCLDCFALGICGGGCPARADFRNGNIFTLDDIFCIHAKKTIQWMIDDLHKQRAGGSHG